jgi:hypothetical protein
LDEHADAEVAVRVAGNYGDATAADAAAADDDGAQLIQKSTPPPPATPPRRYCFMKPYWRKVHSSRMICFIQSDFQFRWCR